MHAALRLNPERGHRAGGRQGFIAIMKAWLTVVSVVVALSTVAFIPRGVAQSIDPRTAAIAAAESPGEAGQDTLQQDGQVQAPTPIPVDPSQLSTPRAVSDGPRPLTADELLAAAAPPPQLLKEPAAPGEFENYIERLLGRKLPRYGSDLLLPSNRDFAQPATASVPPSYIVRPGDTIIIALSGSMEGSVKRDVDNKGRIYLEGVGMVPVAGVRHADLQEVIARAIGTQYRGFTVSVGFAALKGIRVYVTGFANNPGAFTVSSLSTMINASFQAGGPNAGGSFRSIKLYRNGREAGDLDLYELLRSGNRINDLVIENEDVLFIPPAGPQVAIIGSVQQEAIYEALPGETVEQLLALAGGPNTLADSSRVILYRNNGRDISGPQELTRAQAAATRIESGDIIQMLSTGSLAQPLERQSVLVRVEGEVAKPGIYYVPPRTPMDTVIQLAGGLTPGSFLFGTRLTRDSVRGQQRQSYREAIQQLELSLAAAPLVGDSSQSANDRAAQLAGARAVLDRMKLAEPDGRVVLAIGISDTSLPGSILLENNDQIYIPPRPSTVGVFGAVYRPASFIIEQKPLRVRDYIDRAGGTIRAADKGGVFVVRANGEVLSRKRGAMSATVYPGDVVFVPVKTQGSTFWAKFKDITQTLFQLSLSAAAVLTVTN